MYVLPCGTGKAHSVLTVEVFTKHLVALKAHISHTKTRFLRLKGYFSHRVVSVKSAVSKVLLCPYCHGNNSENNDVSPAANVLN